MPCTHRKIKKFMQPRFPEFDDKTDERSQLPITGKRKKRQWFEERYGSTRNREYREVKSNEVCKFYASTGNCRNGERCKFVHEKSSAVRIDEPCKFLFDSSAGCKKSSSCHFSHDLWKFPCPLAFSGVSPRCSTSCGFRHDPITTESSCMEFVRLYRVYLSSLPDAVLNPRWKFYLEEEDESVTLARITRRSESNFFNHEVGTLESIPRIVLDS